MFESNRLRNYVIGLVAGAIVAISISYPLWDAATKLDEAIRAQAYEASEVARHSELAVSQECATIDTTAAEQDCLAATAQLYREAQRDERDLEAQQVMANWTRVMGKAAIIGMGVGIVGLFLIFITFWETRKAAVAGREANLIAKDQQRARILPFARWEPINMGESQVVFACENLGLSPAINLRCALVVKTEPPKQPPRFQEWGERRIIKAGGEADLTLADPKVLSGVLVGCIQYDTLYDKGRKSFVCLRFEQSTRNNSWYAVDCRPEAWPEDT